MVNKRFTWRLNERHYGGLTGLNKQETIDLHGEEKVQEWLRMTSITPGKVVGSIVNDGLQKHTIRFML